ncbi:MAG: hypothetical protein ACR2P0_08055 [Acidimicrobiales bacterium]
MNIFTNKNKTTRIAGSGNMPLYVRGLHRSVYTNRFAITPTDIEFIVGELTSVGGVDQVKAAA